MKFNIDKTFNIDAEVEKRCKTRVSYLWDENGNCSQDKLGSQRWMNVKTAVEFLLKDCKAASVTTECGVVVHRGWII